MENKFKTLAQQIFEKKFSHTKNKIKSIKLIKKGFTNISYLVIDQNNKKYQIRIGNEKINRNNETLLLKSQPKNGGYIYYDETNGNSIKIWFEGKNPTIKECRSDLFIKEFAATLRKFQKIKPDKKISTRNFYCFEKISNFKGCEKLLKKYKEIIEKYEPMNEVVSHNDLRPENLVWNNKKVIFLDFEWATLNHKYWDLANFLREIKYPISDLKTMLKKYFKDVDYKILCEFLYVCTTFAYQWTFFPETSNSILKYRKNTKKLMLDYYKLIS